MKRILSRILLALLAIVVLGMIIPQNLKMPVVGAESCFPVLGAGIGPRP